jgi:hypothetical protein
MASKISKKEWAAILVISGILDFIQFVIIEGILVWLFGIGAAINEVIDPIIGIATVIYLQIRGVEIARNPQRILLLLGTEALAEFTGGVVQLWVIAIWRIKKSVDAEEAAMQVAENSTQSGHHLYQNGMRMQQQSSDNKVPLNRNGVRLPQGGLKSGLRSAVTRVAK